MRNSRNNATSPSQSEDLVVATNPKSSFTEAIKSAKTNIMFSSIDREVQVITITSPEPGDGKSFIAANLGVAFAQDGKKVLIIDGDLRRGRQHHIFNLGSPIATGYSDLILHYKDTQTNHNRQTPSAYSQTATAHSQIPNAYSQSAYAYNDSLNLIAQAIRKTSFSNVHVLPNGPTPPNPLELLSSANNAHLIQKLREYYDIIIIDCPPVLGLSDALVLSKYADANLVTISSNKTKVDQLDAVKKAYEKVNSTISGVIINKTKTSGGTYYNYYASKYYADTDKHEKRH